MLSWGLQPPHIAAGRHLPPRTPRCTHYSQGLSALSRVEVSCIHIGLSPLLDPQGQALLCPEALRQVDRVRPPSGHIRFKLCLGQQKLRSVPLSDFAFASTKLRCDSKQFPVTDVCLCVPAGKHASSLVLFLSARWSFPLPQSSQIV